MKRQSLTSPHIFVRHTPNLDDSHSTAGTNALYSGMGPPRAARRKVIVVSDDEDDDPGVAALPSDPSEDEDSVKSGKRSTGKLRAVKKGLPRTDHPKPSPSTQQTASQKSPAKPKATKSKGKATVKDAPKQNGRPIFSFFNTAVQRQTSQPTPSPEKPLPAPDEIEAIEDDSDDGQINTVRLAKGSSTALALRKRKGHGLSDDLGPSAFGSSQLGSQKFRKVSSGDRVPSLAIVNEDKRPWVEQFAPRDLSELAVHKKKVADVRQWLEMTFNGRRQRVLVLKGAAGTGKTTTIRLLAQDLGVPILEWRNPVDVTSENNTSTAAQFSDFVGRAGRSSGLQLTSDATQQSTSNGLREHMEPPATENGRSILLIEEYPNTFSRSSGILHAFRSTIMQYLSSTPLMAGHTPSPIVMIISETLLSTNTALADSFTAHRLLGPELANHPYLDMIEFNAVAPTYLTKALETIVVKEARKSGRRRTPGPQVVKHLAESGDVRSAVSSLEFLCLRGDDDGLWSSKVVLGKGKKSKADIPLTTAEEEALKLVSNRETTLGIFHGVGKVVYNKRADSSSITHPPPWLPQHRRHKAPENDVDGMLNELGTDTATFIAALHENYALSCGAGGEDSLDSLLGCINSISDADLLSADRFSSGTRAYSGSAADNLRQDDMAFQTAVRGILFDLPHPVHRSTTSEVRRGDAHKMFYPSSLRLWKKQEEVESVIHLLTAKFQSGSLSGASTAGTSGVLKGVDSWRGAAVASAGDSPESASNITNSMKTEMLLERLPFMSQILLARPNFSSISEKITAVTRIRGNDPVDNTADAEMEDGGDVPGVEQWATDKPDGDAGTTSPVKKKKAKGGVDGRGLLIPVESSMDRLVIEEDDIVDDFG